MKIYRLTVEGDGGWRQVIYDSSEGRLTRHYDNAIRSRATRYAEIAVCHDRRPTFNRKQMLDALNGRADQWKWTGIVGYERQEKQKAA